MEKRSNSWSGEPAPFSQERPGLLRRSARWVRKHPVRAALCLMALLLLLLNFLAFAHAHSMTHFTAAGERTKGSEALSFFGKIKLLATGVRIPRPCNDATPESLGLPFSTHRFPSRDGIGLEAWLVPHPQSKGIVLLFHGYACCKGRLLPEAKAFHELGYTSFLVDFRGSGGSDGSATTIGYQEADDVAAAVRFVQSQWPEQPLILYGQSMGSAAILRAICTFRLRPTAAVVECPFDSLLATVRNRFRVMGLPAFPAAQCMVLWGGMQHGFNGFGHNPAEYAKEVRCPVLQLHGEEDTRVTKEQAESIFHNLDGEKQFVVFPALGHESYVASSPQRWKRHVDLFLHRNAAKEPTTRSDALPLPSLPERKNR